MKARHNMACLMLIALTTACGGASLVNDTLSTDISHTVSQKTVVNDLGYDVTLSHAEIGFQRLTLISAGDDLACEAGHDYTIDLNTSEDVLADDFTPRTVGAFDIPPRAYCQYALVMGPGTEAAAHTHDAVKHGGSHADADSALLTVSLLHHPSGATSTLAAAHAAAPAAHSTIHLEGTWSKNGGPRIVFAIDSLELVTITATFQSDHVAHPLTLHDGTASSAIMLGVRYDALFDGVDFETVTDVALHDIVLHNLPSIIHQHALPH